MKSYWDSLLIQVLCLRLQWHDTGTSRSGTCRRCHLYILENGRAL